jgi:catalase
MASSTLNPVTREIKRGELLTAQVDDVLAKKGDPVAYDLRGCCPFGQSKSRYVPTPFANANVLASSIPDPSEEGPSMLTSNLGVIIEDNDSSLKVGPRGPPLFLQDRFVRQKIMHFDHEQIPERIVHARGSGAMGEFICTRDCRDITMASFLSEVGKKTPVAVRFSQVVGSKGSSDTVRDVRGFAAKFYTDEGNYDAVFNDIPVFFIQDGAKFPDLVHAIKPAPHNEMPQASGAHDNFWDFISLTSESAHMIMWLLSDIGFVRSYRTMEGHSVNAFKFINSQGQVHLVKLRFTPHQGVETMSAAEARRIAGEDPDYLRRDLWEAIKRGIFPKWDFEVQLIPLEQQHNFPFDPLDATKVWPEDLVPIIKLGELTLNTNPSNFFSEVEQIAFCPANLVTGIDVSDDPLLQIRLFSYDDTQLNRFHSANWEQLPINRPVVPVRNNQQQGFMRQTIRRNITNYEPNTRSDGYPIPANKVVGIQGFVNDKEHLSGYRTRSRPEKFADHYSQAQQKWQLMTPEQREHLIGGFHYELGHVEDVAIRKKIIAMFSQVSPDLAEAIAAGLVLD